MSFCHSAISAKSVDFAINRVNGSSTYEVEAKSLGLRSKLNFPYDFQSLNISFYDEFLQGMLNIGVSIPIFERKEIAEDYDWKNDQLTVFSSSDSYLDKYYSVHVEWEAELINRFGLSSKLLLQELDTFWTDTKQYDYVKDTESFSSENTLQFEQNYLLYDLGINYQAWKTKKTNFAVEVKYIAGLVKSKDTHILRNFYTLHDSKVSGYSFGVKFGYSLGSTGNLSFGFINNNLIGQEAIMNYYSSGGSKFATYPARYQNKSNIYQITFHKDL